MVDPGTKRKRRRTLKAIESLIEIENQNDTVMMNHQRKTKELIKVVSTDTEGVTAITAGLKKIIGTESQDITRGGDDDQDHVHLIQIQRMMTAIEESATSGIGLFLLLAQDE